jgi:fructose-specific phosphotransferase system component IIB
MKLTLEDFAERVARFDAGVATDEDLRLIKHYKRQGFSVSEEVAVSSGVDNPVGMTQIAEADVISAADKSRALEYGYDLDDMLANGEDVSEILKEVRE